MSVERKRPIEIAAVLADDAEVHRRSGVAALVSASERSLGLDQLAMPAQQDPEAEGAVRAARLVRAAERVLRSREVARALESGAEL